MRFDVLVDHEQLRRARSRVRTIYIVLVGFYLVMALALGTVTLGRGGMGAFVALIPSVVFLLILAVLFGILAFGQLRWYSGADVPPIALTLEPRGVTAYVERQPTRQIPWPQAKLSLGKKLGQPMLRLDSPGQKRRLWGLKILVCRPDEIDQAIRAMTNGQRALEH